MHRLLPLLSVLVPHLVAHAQDARTARLDYDAPDGCLDAARFADEVAARVGRVPFADDAEATLRVRAREDDGAFLVTWERAGEGVRAFRDPSCDEALFAAAASLAVYFEEPARAAIYGPVGMLRTEPEPEPEPDPEPSDGRVRVSITANEPGWTLHVETNTGVGSGSAVFYRRLCAAPCEARLSAGSHGFGVSRGDDRIPTAIGIHDVSGPSELRIDHEPPSRVSLAGRWLAAISMFGWLVAIPLAATDSIRTHRGRGNAPRFDSRVTWGVAAATVGLFVGGVVMGRFGPGHLELEVAPRGS